MDSVKKSKGHDNLAFDVSTITTSRKTQEVLFTCIYIVFHICLWAYLYKDEDLYFHKRYIYLFKETLVMQKLQKCIMLYVQNLQGFIDSNSLLFKVFFFFTLKTTSSLL